MRILLHTLFRLVDIYKPQHFNCSFVRLLFISAGVQQNRFHNLMADGVRGVERGHRVLEYDGDLVASYLTHGLFTGINQLLTVKLD